MPVLRGRTPQDYERCADALHCSMLPGTIVGVGSMCRRDVHGPEGLIAVVRHLDCILPSGVRLHLFGVKGAALPWRLPFAARVASIDSQAWGTAARRDAHRLGRSKSDAFAAGHMERWTAAQLDRLQTVPRHAVPTPPAATRQASGDPWEQAIAQAHEEIRSLIESGDLSHDEITAGWVETWAADLLHQGGRAA